MKFAGKSDLNFQLFSFFCVVILFLGCISWLYEPVFSSNFHEIPGYRGDPQRTILVIIDHWYRFFVGEVDWRTHDFFYPVKNTLGYSDTFFGFGLIYSFLRLVGLNVIEGYQGLYLTLDAIYMIGVYLLFTSIGKVKGTYSAIAALICGGFGPLLHHGGYTQLYAVAFIPYLIISYYFIISSLLSNASPPLFKIGLSSLITALAFFNAFYMIWLFGIFCMFFCIICGVHFYRQDRKALKSYLIDRKKNIWRYGLFFTLTFFVFMMPFFIVYLPVLSQKGGSSYSTVAHALPSFFDFIDMGHRNIWYGEWIKNLHPNYFERGIRWEKNFAFTPILMLCFIGSSIYWNKRHHATKETKNFLIWALALAVLVYWLFMLKIGKESLWGIIYNIVPGGKAVRAVFRAQIVLVIPATFVICHCLQSLLAKITPGRKLIYEIAFIAILAVMFIEQKVNFVTHDSKKILEMLTLAQPVPGSCSSFYITGDNSNQPSFSRQRDAQFVSAMLKIPTINGFSSNFPEFYPGKDPNAPEYKSKIQKWIDVHNLTNVCSLNLESGQWNNHEK